MKSFVLSSDKESNLAEIGESDIIIKKIVPVVANYQHLRYPLWISQKFPDGSTHSYYLHPITYYSNYNRAIETDKVIDEIISHCKYTTISICLTPDDTEIIKLTIHYESLNYLIDELEISIVKQLDGFNYSLSPISYKEIKTKFPNINPVKSIFASFDVKSSFENLHGSIDKYIIPALTDLDENSLKLIKKIKYIDPRTNQIINEEE